VPFYKKQLRLPLTNYQGPRLYFVTIVTANRSPYFADLTTGRWLIAMLLETAAKFSFSLHAYCAMPDHLHFLCEGRSDACNLTKFVEVFKQRTAHEFTNLRSARLWQKRYYDHILRPNEPAEAPACYIWSNPLRKNLCTNPREYPLAGSQTIDWMKNNPSPKNWLPPWKKVL